MTRRKVPAATTANDNTDAPTGPMRVVQEDGQWFVVGNGQRRRVASNMEGMRMLMNLVPAEPTTAPPEEPVVEPESPVEEPVQPPKKRRAGVSREDVVALLKATGLQLTEKSSSHWGDPKGVRLVLPPAESVTRIFVYKLDELSSLAGFKTREERTAQRLGAVTHVIDVEDIEVVKLAISAVAAANGLQDDAGVPRKGSKAKAKGNQGGAKKGATPTQRHRGRRG